VTDGLPGAVYCGQPMKFYNLNRPRDDFAPTCHRRPHEGSRHASAASVTRDRERQRGRKNRGRAHHRVLSDPPATVTT
jgi:hypothetical protein